MKVLYVGFHGLVLQRRALLAILLQLLGMHPLHVTKKVVQLYCIVLTDVLGDPALLLLYIGAGLVLRGPPASPVLIVELVLHHLHLLVHLLLHLLGHLLGHLLALHLLIVLVHHHLVHLAISRSL